MAELKDIITDSQREALNEAGFHTLEEVMSATPEQLSVAHGFGEARSAELIEEARTALAGAGDSSASKTEPEEDDAMYGLVPGRMVYCRPTAFDGPVPGIVAEVFDAQTGGISVVAFSPPRAVLGGGRSPVTYARVSYSKQAQDGEEELDQGCWMWPQD